MYTIVVGPIFYIQPRMHCFESQRLTDGLGYATSFKFMDLLPAWDEPFHLEPASETSAGGQP